MPALPAEDRMELLHAAAGLTGDTRYRHAVPHVLDRDAGPLALFPRAA